MLYRIMDEQLQFFLVHPGGPFFVRKDDGHWTVPKGEFPADEAPLDAAVREFEEETGYRPSGDFIPLQPVVQKGGKHILCWGVAGDMDAAALRSNTFELEWPPSSGKKKMFPEVDKAGWFNMEDARRKIKAAQIPLLEELAGLLGRADVSA